MMKRYKYKYEYQEALNTMCENCINHEICKGTGCEPKKYLGELVDRATPKKGYAYSSDGKRWVEMCPTCNIELTVDWGMPCDICGQAIDYED